MIDDFDSVASELIEAYGGIDSLQLAPGGIVSQIYPLKGNERAIGHDLLNDPARRSEARMAVESGRLTLAGPFVPPGAAADLIDLIDVSHAEATVTISFSATVDQLTAAAEEYGEPGPTPVPE